MKSLSKTKVIYLDYNATHPPFSDVLQDCLKSYSEEFFNPSGITRFSLKNQGKIENARQYFSHITKFSEKDIVFTSTGTESNYLMLQFLSLVSKEKDAIISPFEHSAMTEGLIDLGFQYRVLKTNKSGLVDLDHLKEMMRSRPAPVICLMAGNETGVLQPVEEISQVCAEYEVGFYSDLMQAFGKTSVNFSLFSGFTFSGHKIGSGPGASLVGFSKIPKNTHIFGGGNQENGHRAGTENLISIASFPLVSEIQLKNLPQKESRLSYFQKQLESALEELGAEIVAKQSPRLSNTTFAILPVEELDFFLMGVEERGICIATGSSCKSRAREASKSLLSMGYTQEEALRAIRISTGFFTTEQEIGESIAAFRETITRLQH